MPLATPISLDAQRIIRQAFEDLERAVSASDRVSLQNTTLDDVRQAAHLVEDELAARQSLRNMRRLEPLFTGLAYYSKTIEVLCNGTPYMPWIWAPIKLILKISSDHIEAFEKIIKAYGQIAEPLKRFQKINSAFSSDKDVQQTLAIFYSDILKFHKEAYQFVRRNSWRLLFLTSWGRFQRRFEGIIQDLKAHEGLVDKMALATNISESKDLRRKIDMWRQEQLERLAKEEAEQITAQYLAITAYLKVDESTNAKIFEAIASEAAANVGTSSWILKQPEMQAWLRCHQSCTFLLLNGRPGSGKSVLATQIVQFLQLSQRSLVVSQFCTYAYEESMDYDKILKGLLLQLIRSDTDLIAYVYDTLLRKKKVPNSKIVEGLILDSVRASSIGQSLTRYIHVVIDGLDECNQTTQPKVTKLLKRMVSTAFSSGSTVCKVMLSSRTSPAITRTAKQSQTLCLSDENKNLEKAIETYALHRLTLLEPQISQLQISQDDICTLSRGIAKKAEGMFLWARLVLDYLANNIFLQRQEILSAAEVFPRALQQFYDKLLTQITSHFDERSLERMKLIFEWIAFAKRPLRKAEFRSALAFSSGNPDIDELAPQYLFDKCSPLIEERRDSTFSFIHVSVRDYLESADSIMTINESKFVSSHGQTIAACLVSGLHIFTPNYPEHKRQLSVLRGIHAFHPYASQYWVHSVLDNSKAPQTDARLNFFTLCSELCAKFHPALGISHNGDNEIPAFLDKCLSTIQLENRLLCAVVQRILAEERDTYFEEPSPEDYAVTEMVQVTSLKSLLGNYQRTIQQLLLLRACASVSLHDLERFRQEFRTSAFTCRLPSCPRSTDGFEDHSLRLAHESSHRRILCDVQGCLYPPFPDTEALRRHQRKCHKSQLVDTRRKVIRKISKSTLRPEVSTQTEQRSRPLITEEVINRHEQVKADQSPSSIQDPSRHVDSTDKRRFQAAKAASARPASQPNQPQQHQGPRMLTPQQLAALTPEQRAKYEVRMRAQMNKAGQMPPQGGNEIMARLKALGQEEQRQFVRENDPEIPMSQQEYQETADKLKRIVVDMSKISRGLGKWYGLTRDDQRAKMFFRTRWRILKQFSDGDKMSAPKSVFTMQASEIDQARNMLESMAKDLAASVYARNMKMANRQGTPQAQNAQSQQSLSQQQQPQPPQPQQPTQPQAAPANSERIRRNSQAQNTTPKGGNKGSQAPAAPTTSQPPFQFGASSPHGNPTYVAKPKELNLQLPPSRKRQKTTTGQTPQSATPSPQISKKGSPELRRTSDSQVPPKPVLTCKEPECEFSTTEYSTEKALQQHIYEEYTKTREDPLKFAQENLALALGLEPDGTVKREPGAKATMMSLTNSKQGQTPVTMAATPDDYYLRQLATNT
ncbi:hypothetical protein V3481_017379 [Fusarium oxysporum f. sp. vasinfectum]|uniref:Uncharacterized protein n=1 Tax=Fusarium oxysporum f. sp. vasinfectum 25433 TaxID=1089449 RepID=X0KHB0_FUSOX|nr:hypothetical protein FOTG_18525 [Fusarium oxysporum f. sp. vasinfectum 25433]